MLLWVLFWFGVVAVGAPFELVNVAFELLLCEFPNIAFSKDDSDELLLWFLLKMFEYDAGDNGGVLDLLDDAVDSIMEDGLEGIFSFMPEVFLFDVGLVTVKWGRCCCCCCCCCGGGGAVVCWE